MKLYMRFVFFLLTLAGGSLLTDCGKQSSFVINGTLPSSEFDGEYIYWVPMLKASKERVDSAKIIDSKFQITGHADSLEFYILRAKPMLRLRLQELLVLNESGTIKATIGRISSAEGTPLNDSLQRWKGNMEMHDSFVKAIKQDLNKYTKEQKQQLAVRMDSMESVYARFNYNFIVNNRSNKVGRLVYNIICPVLTKEQKAALSFAK